MIFEKGELGKWKVVSWLWRYLTNILILYSFYTHFVLTSNSLKHSLITFGVFSISRYGFPFCCNDWYLRPSSRTKLMNECRCKTMRLSAVCVTLIWGERLSRTLRMILLFRSPFSTSNPAFPMMFTSWYCTFSSCLSPYALTNENKKWSEGIVTRKKRIQRRSFWGMETFWLELSGKKKASGMKKRMNEWMKAKLERKKKWMKEWMNEFHKSITWFSQDFHKIFK